MEGNAREAIQFYQQAIDAEVLSLVTYGEMPDMPNTFTVELMNLVAHAMLRVGESELMLSDAPTGSTHSKRKTGDHLPFIKRRGKVKTIF